MKPLSTIPPSTETLRHPSHEEIAQRARELWEKQGRPVDRDEEIWLEAERQLLSAMSPPSTPAVAAAPRAPSEPASESEEPRAAAKPRSRSRPGPAPRSGGLVNTEFGAPCAGACRLAGASFEVRKGGHKGWIRRAKGAGNSSIGTSAGDPMAGSLGEW